MIDLDARLRRAGQILDDALADQPSPVPAGSPSDVPSTALQAASHDRARTSRVRRRALAIAAVLLLVATAGVVLLTRSRAHQTVNLTPVASDVTTPTDVSVAPTAAPEPATTTTPPASVPAITVPVAIPSTTTTPAISVPDLAVPVADLTGPGAGMYIDPAVLPAGLQISAAASDGGQIDAAGGSSQASSTVLVQYNADRSRLLGSIEVRVTEAGTAKDLSSLYGDLTPTALSIGGSAVSDSGAGPVWVDGDRTVAVLEYPVAHDLTRIATGLVRRADGGFDAGWLPDGFEQIAVVPGTQSGTGPQWLTSYKLASANDVDSADVNVMVFAHRPLSAEASWALHYRYGHSGQAVTVDGRRMIVYGPDLGPVRVEFELSTGDVVVLSVATNDGSRTQPTATAVVVLAAALRRATDQQWATMQAQSATNTATWQARAWIEQPFAARGLTVISDQTVSNQIVPSGPVSMGSAIIEVVHATDSVGTEWACEFLHQQLLTCTSENGAAEQSAMMVSPELLRVAAPVGPSTQIVFQAANGNSGGTTALPLFHDNVKHAVAYFDLSGFSDSYTTGCVDIGDEAGNFLGSIAIDGTTIDQSHCRAKAALGTMGSVAVTTTSVAVTNQSVPQP